jgi:hypothetical protein
MLVERTVKCRRLGFAGLVARMRETRIVYTILARNLLGIMRLEHSNKDRRNVKEIGFEDLEWMELA